MDLFQWAKYKDESHDIEFQLDTKNETVWATTKKLAELFDCSEDNIRLHIKNIILDKELDEKTVAEDFSVTASDGKNYTVKHYNLDMAIAIGYRVNKNCYKYFIFFLTFIFLV